jgi:hypothetical protein
MKEHPRWGSFEGFLTWRNWVGAFSLGMLATLFLLNPFHTPAPLRAIVLVSLALEATRELLAFRRKARVLMNLLEHNGA